MFRNRCWRLLAVFLCTSLFIAGCKYKADNPRYITDDQGRALILHGLNTSSSAKSHPERMPWISQADVEREARDWGFNFVRFLIFWDAIEPQPGVYDEAYLDKVAERVKWYEDQGMYVLLDMHQDLYAYQFGGDGAPPWATITDGLPAEPQSPWWITYLQPGVSRAFDHFWRNDYGLQDHYADMWTHVAKRFKDTPNVIGYDLMNEPYGGTYVWPGFETFQLQPFYERVINRIRTVDQDTWLFIEPQALGINFGVASTLGVIDDPREGEERLVYAPHFYPPFLHEGGAYSDVDKWSFEPWGRERVNELNKMNMPIVVGEFGVGANQPGAGEFIDDVTLMADYMGSGWAYWSNDRGGWSPTDGSDNETIVAEHLTRTYPQAIAGQPVDYYFEAKSKEFRLVYDEKPGVTGPTEIYIPASRYYQDGWELSVSDPDGSWRSEWNSEREILKLWLDPGQPRHEVRVSPKYKNLYMSYLGKCIDVNHSGTENGTNVHLWNCNGSDAQGWVMDEDGALHSKVDPRMCLDVSGALQHDGNNIQLWECNGTNAQRWVLDTDNGVLRSALNQGKCLDVKGAGSGNGSNVHLWSCQGRKAQQVLVKAEQPAVYKPLKSGERCMDIAGGNMADGSNVLLWDCHNGDNQQWRYEPLTGLIHSKKDPGYCLDNRGMAYDGGEVTIWRCTDSDNLRFDWYGNTLRNRHDSNIAVTATNHENGADIRQATFDNIDTQKWR